MPSRRQFLRLAFPTLAVLAAERLPAHAQDSLPPQVYIPIAQSDAVPTPEPPPVEDTDAPIVGAASGTIEQASAWFSARCSAAYTTYDVGTIVARYRDLGEWAGMDWFLALAQMGHETGHMTSWWSQRPRRNPAGIGVTGRTEYGTKASHHGAKGLAFLPGTIMAFLRTSGDCWPTRLPTTLPTTLSAS